MKMIIIKVLLLTLYVAVAAIIWSLRGVLDNFYLLLTSFTLLYCGIVVLSQLQAAVVTFFQWCMAASQEKRTENLSGRSVVFETETEAT